MSDQSSCRGRRFESISASAHSCEQGRLMGQIEFSPEISNIDIDDVGFALIVIVPDRGKNLLAGKESTLIAGKVLKQRILSSGKGDLSFAPPDPMRNQVDPQISKLDCGGVRLIEATSERSNSGDQFLEGIRLCDVVIRADIQSADLALEIISSSQHDDGEIASKTAQFRERFGPRLTWQHDVQQNQIDRFCPDEQHALFAGFRDHDLMPVRAQTTVNSSSDFRLVFDDQDSHICQHEQGKRNERRDFRSVHEVNHDGLFSTFFVH